MNRRTLKRGGRAFQAELRGVPASQTLSHGTWDAEGHRALAAVRAFCRVSRIGVGRQRAIFGPKQKVLREKFSGVVNRYAVHTLDGERQQDHQGADDVEIFVQHQRYCDERDECGSETAEEPVVAVEGVDSRRLPGAGDDSDEGLSGCTSWRRRGLASRRPSFFWRFRVGARSSGVPDDLPRPRRREAARGHRSPSQRL
jgi:hypothetical protein